MLVSKRRQIENFMLSLCLLLLWCTVVVEAQVCPNSCSQHGNCNNPTRVCECFAGYFGGDCSLRYCPKGPAWADQAIAVDDAHNLAECSNMGLCDYSTGICTCNTGFEGDACQRKSCPNLCNSAGYCLSMQDYATTMDIGAGPVYSYTKIWDAQQMFGCSCDDGYEGPDCTVRKCPTGDDPLTGNGANTVTNPTQVNEIQQVTCKAVGGYFTLTFRGYTTANIPFNAKADPEGANQVRTAGSLQSYIEALPSIGSLGTIIIMPSLQACLQTGATWTVEFTQNFGDLPLLVPGTTGLTSVATTPVSVTQLVQGTKEDAVCSNRGICDTSSGVCTCSTNYETSNGYNAPGTRGDCGYAMTTIQYCPGTLSCSGHGVGQCPGYPTYKCTCIAGWTGADCSLRTCPSGVSWFSYPSADNTAHLYNQAECSDMGTCDRTNGQCICAVGFSGSACQLLNCPGILLPCNGNGQCLDMYELAQQGLTTTGDLGGYTYGATPNNPYTWDAFMVQGCLCDAGYGGYDCSLLTCPTGDNPDTINQFDEQQVISCLIASPQQQGTFQLSFRQQTTSLLNGNISSSELQQVLSSLSTINKVAVDIFTENGPDQLCTSDGNQFIVTFLSTHGALPLLLIPTQNNIDSITVTEQVQGTKENDVCSDRGLCDYTTGKCTCFDGYGSSDGMGNMGSIGDCGFVQRAYLNIIT